MKKIMIVILAILICFLGLFILFLPSILSSNIGKNFLIQSLQENSQTKVKIETVSFSWIKPQKITLFHLEKKGELVFSFDSVTLNSSFWNLLLRRGSLGEATLVKPQLILQTAFSSPHSGSHSISSHPKTSPIIQKDKSKKQKTFWSHMSGNIVIEDGLLSLQHMGSDLIRMDDIHFKLDMSTHFFPLSIDIQGKTKYNQLLGSFYLKGNIEQQKEIIELETADALQIDGEANFNNFPIGGIDALFSLIHPSMQGMLIQIFGDYLNLDLLCSKSGKDQNFSLQLRSPRMMLSLLADYQKGLIQLRNPLKAVWTIKPLLIQTFKTDIPFTLIGDTHAEISIERLNLLFKNMKFDIRSLAVAGKINIQRGAFTLAKNKDSFLLDELDLSFDANRLEDLVNLSFQNTFRFNSFPQTKLQGSSSFTQLFANKDWITKLTQLDLNIRNFPTPLLNTHPSKTKKIEKWVGSSFDLTAKKYEQDGKQSLILSANSPLINFSNTHFIIQDAIILKTPMTFNYQLNPSHWESLVHPITLNGSIQHLMIPIKNRIIEWPVSKIDMNLKSQDIQIKNCLNLGALNLPLINFQLKGSLGHSIHFTSYSNLDFAKKTWGHSIFGQDSHLQASGNFNLIKEFQISPLNITLESSKFKSNVDGAIESNAFILKKPLKIDFILEPEQINPLLVKEGKLPLLVENTPVQLQIQPGTFPVHKDSLSELDLKAIGSISTVKMIQAKTHFPFSLQNVDLKFDLNSKKKLSRIQLDADALEEGKEKGFIELLIENDTGNINFINNPSRTQLRFNHLSTQIGDALFQMNGTLQPMIGSWMDFDLDLQKQDIAIHLKSPYFKMNGVFHVYDKFELKNNRNPLKVEWNISEEGYAAYKKWQNLNHSQNTPAFVIKDHANIKLNISPLSLSLKAEKKLFPQVDMNLYKAIFDVDMKIDSLIFQQERTNELTELNHFNLNLSKASAPGPFTFEVQGNVSPKGSEKNGLIKGKGKLDHFLTQQGDVSLENVSASIHAKIQYLPTVFLDALSNINNPSGIPPSAFLGDLVNASCEAEVIKENGKLNIDVNASNCQIILDGTIDNGLLYLTKPLKATMTISPKMNEILARSAKIMVSSMKNPIDIIIDNKEFSIPIKNLTFKDANLSYGTIDFGQITCRNTGSASDVSSIFKMEGNKNLISLWFAPMAFNIHNGLMYIDRTEILYNRAYQVALWGNIDFIHRYVDMTLGLTAQSLRTALGIRDLDSNYVLQIPVEGPFDHVQIDKETATTKIAFLIARKQIAPHAGVWGQVFSAIGGLADDQSGVPPPKPPFPWQKVLNMQEKTTTDKELKALYKKKTKSYQKEIKQLLKQS